MGRHEYLEIKAHDLANHLPEDERPESLVGPGKVMASRGEEIEEKTYE